MHKFDLDHYVVQSNDLITAQWKMDRITMKLFEMAVSAVDVSKSTVSKVNLKKSDVFYMFQADDTNKYTRFDDHIQKLLKQVVKIRIDNDRIGALVPITYVEWGTKKDDQTVEIIFNPKIMPYILDLKMHFTKYKISNLTRLNSKYAIILYKLAKMNQWKDNRILYQIDELREITDTKDVYDRFDNFERRVLKVAVAEINAGYTDIVIAYEKVKQGRRITAVEFKVRERLSVYDNNYYKPIQPKAFNCI